MQKTKGRSSYIHGFSPEEQARLQRQAEFIEFLVYQDINFSDHQSLLEIGSGVGAQSAILLRRFPKTKLTCIEMNPKQIAAAKSFLSGLGYAKGRYEILQMDATDLEIEEACYDAAFICWVLEHVKDPVRILAEARRVLKPGAVIYVTEVMNSSFFLDPYSPNTWKYWMAFNDYQYDQSGDPFVGAKLGNLLLSQGFQDITTTVKVMHYDNRLPKKRRDAVREWTELLLSASERLIQAKYVDTQIVDAMKQELKSVESNPNAVFFNAFIQARAIV